MRKLIAVISTLLICSMLFGGCAFAGSYGSYTVELESGEMIYSGPGYGYKYKGDVGKTAYYTIIDEAWDYDGNLWGELKSGAGWVVLEKGDDYGVPYTIELDKNEPIYSGPGFGYKYKKTVGKTAVYTIIEEEWDGDGNLWGELKSGAGWVVVERSGYSAVPYTMQLHALVPIYSGPGYDYRYKDSVGETAVYTIVEEQLDDDGLIWGRLKSDAGWINVSYARMPLMACIVNDDLLRGLEYDQYIARNSRYMEKIAFVANEPLKNVEFTALESGNSFWGVEQSLETVRRMSVDEVFVLGVSFYGDITAYGVSFTDNSGYDHEYTLYISDRNGALMIDEVY